MKYATKVQICLYNITESLTMSGQQCMICGNVGTIQVHGHVQCSRCGVLQEGCCEGSGTSCPPTPSTTKVKDDPNERIEEQ